MKHDPPLDVTAGLDPLEMLDKVPPRFQGAARWLFAHWPGRIGLRVAATCVQLGLFDRAMTIAAQFFTSVLPMLILLVTLSGQGFGWIESAVSMPDEQAAVVEDAVGGSSGAAFGIIGTLLVLISATSLSRALTRAYADIWQVGRPRTTVRTPWRWLAVVVVLALSLVAVRALSTSAGDLPPPYLWGVAVSVAGDVAVMVFVPWVLMSGLVRARHLVPGALIFSFTMIAIRPATQAYLPRALEESADRYGSIGVAFTYLAFLYIVSWCLLAAAILGRALVVDEGPLGVWLRGRPEPEPEREPNPEPGGVSGGTEQGTE